jgi:N-ethylmaleimide reductase
MTVAALLRPLKVGPLDLPSRVVMPALTRMRAGSDGVPTELTREYYAQRAGAGLIIAECTQVSPQARGFPGCPGIYNEEQVAGWRRVTDAVHAAGGRIFCQVWHAGGMSHPSNQPDDALPIGPSSQRPLMNVLTSGFKPAEMVPPRALETDELPDIVAQFARAAERAIRAGFDGLEIHGANGYLLEQFMKRSTNCRTDAYGGSAENRARFTCEVVDAVTDVVGAQSVGLRLSPWGELNSPVEEDAAVYEMAAQHASRRRIAYLHVIEPRSSMSPTSDAVRTVELDAATFFRPLFDGVLISAGGWTFDAAEAAIAAGKVDAVAFGRLFIANPDLVQRFSRGAPLNAYNRASFYGGGQTGYTDYPFLEVVEAS